MKTLKLARALKGGFLNFYRDKWLTLATISVMSLTLYLIGITVFLALAVQVTITNIEKRINISVYFNDEVSEKSILEIKTSLEDQELQEVKSIQFVSRDEALDKFKEYAQDDKALQESIELVGDNPLPHSLVVTATQTSDYATINAFFQDQYGELVSDTSYEKNQGTIEQIRDRMIFVRNATTFLSGLFIMIAVLVTFNTVRMSIYAHRKEFEVMRLVGASNTYVKVPVVFEGMLYGLASSVLAIIALAATVYLVEPFTQNFLVGSDITDLYFSESMTVIAATLFSGLALGFFSSYIAIRRYLER